MSSHPKDTTRPGAVTFQRERHFCGGCRRTVAVVRAVRTADNWHSDWECVHVVTGDGHRRAPLARRDPDVLPGQLSLTRQAELQDVAVTSAIGSVLRWVGDWCDCGALLDGVMSHAPDCPRYKPRAPLGHGSRRTGGLSDD